MLYTDQLAISVYRMMVEVLRVMDVIALFAGIFTLHE